MADLNLNARKVQVRPRYDQCGVCDSTKTRVRLTHVHLRALPWQTVVLFAASGARVHIIGRIANNKA